MSAWANSRWPLDDIKRFRQLESKCPGHPEYRWTSGVETTTGPLGQGVAVSVGMALAGQWMREYFNRPDFEMVGYDVYALCGDGCTMEGISGEAASLAGPLDSNKSAPSLCGTSNGRLNLVFRNRDIAALNVMR